MAEQQAQQGKEATTTEAEGIALDDLINKFDPRSKKDQVVAQRAKDSIETVIRQALEAKPGTVVSGDVERTIQAWKAQIDEKLSVQLNEILHHP
jgi:type VI secretion system protein ImpC